MSVTNEKPTSTDEVAARHQAYLDKVGLRTAQGSFYTPLMMVERIYQIALEDLDLQSQVRLGEPFRIIDPTCGTGNFLAVGALILTEIYIKLGHAEETALPWVLENCIFGADIDELAVQECVRNLSRLTSKHVDDSKIRKHFHVGNALLLQQESDADDALFSMVETTWATVFPEVFESDDPGFDAVFGNPPFLNQLNTETALSDDIIAMVRQSLGAEAQSLTNAASLFLSVSLEIVKEIKGMVALVQPMSILATRDSLQIRRSIDKLNSLSAVWVCEEQVFDAAVQTCVLFIKPGDGRIPIYATSKGTYVTALSRSNELGSWSRYLHASKGYASIQLSNSRSVGDLANSFNDFRDEYYGLVGHILDEEDKNDRAFPKLLTVGKIEFCQNTWGEYPTKFAKEQFQFPRVDVEKLDEKLQKWAGGRSVPKILVATQTKAIELFVDDKAEFLPSIPIATVIPKKPDDLWLVAACLAAPPVSLYAYERLAGAGMSSQVLKVSARFIDTIPLPSKLEMWILGAEYLREVHALDANDPTRTSQIENFCDAMCDAYEIGNLKETVKSWWLDRI